MQSSSPTNGKYGCVKWHYFTKTLFHQHFLAGQFVERSVQDQEALELTSREFLCYRVMPQMGSALEISSDSQSNRHTPDPPGGEKQAVGMVFISARP